MSVPARTVCVYADESSQQHRYMILGSVWVAKDRIPKITMDLQSLRENHGVWTTLKWSSISNAYYPPYKALLNLFLKHSPSHMSYNCLILETGRLDHQTHNFGDAELGYYKFFYELFHHRMRFKNALYEIVMDRRNNRRVDRLSTLQDVLNTASYLRADQLDRPVRSIRPGVTKHEQFLQINDVITGAVAYHANGHHEKKHASPAKVRLVSHLCRALRRSRLSHQTAAREARFNVWRFALQKKTKP